MVKRLLVFSLQHEENMLKKNQTFLTGKILTGTKGIVKPTALQMTHYILNGNILYILNNVKKKVVTVKTETE